MDKLSKLILPKDRLLDTVDYTMPTSEFERVKTKLYDLFDEREKDVEEIKRQDNGRIRVHFYTCLAGNCEPWDSYLDYVLRKEVGIKGLRRVPCYISVEEYMKNL